LQPPFLLQDTRLLQFTEALILCRKNAACKEARRFLSCD